MEVRPATLDDVERLAAFMTSLFRIVRNSPRFSWTFSVALYDPLSYDQAWQPCVWCRMVTVGVP